MDPTKYSGTSATLIQKITERAQNPASRVFAPLRELEQIAKASSDNDLLGFVYYHYALAYYARGKHRELVRYIKLAISYLVRQDDRDLLAAAYNVFAVEAKTNGCFEVALDYYYTAHSLVEDDKDSLGYALTGANIGDLLSQMGRYKEAATYHKYIRRGLKILERDKNQATARSIIAVTRVNLGLSALNNQKYEDALKEAAYFEQLGPAAVEEMGETIALFYLIFRLRLSIAEKDQKRSRRLLEELQEKVAGSTLSSEFVQELLDVAAALLKAGDLASADRLLLTLRQKTRMNTYAKYLFFQLRIAYYAAVGNDQKRMECYAERDAAFRKQKEVKNFFYYESISLMAMLEDLRREEEQIRKETLAIQRNAETDALTGIPNRYAMGIQLEHAFSEARQNQTTLGIGIVDIDNFKKFNDTFGHRSGDKCLIEVARILQEIGKRHAVFVARYGGDEFVFIYKGLAGKEIRAVEKEILAASPVSVTHGFYNAIPKVHTKFFDYMAKADQKLYQNKQKSGARLRWI